jgi:hypothetical protein
MSAPNARTDDSTRTWALDFNVKVLIPVRWRHGQRLQTPPELQMALICVNPETLTTDDAQESITLAVSDGDDRIVKGLNVRDAVSNVLAYFCERAGQRCYCDFSHEDLSIISSDAAALRGPLRVCIGAGTLAAH